MITMKVGYIEMGKGPWLTDASLQYVQELRL